MKKILSCLCVASGLGFAGAAYADIYAAGPAYGGNPSGGTVVCRVFNAGLSAANITSRQIIDNTGAIAPLTNDTCNVAVAAAKYCAFTANIPGNFAYSCRIFSSGADENLRGTIGVFVGSTLLSEMPLTK